ncbi:hypothetical protein KQX54_013724 [Cotesia glomerata]|uniref:FLYWCH-type domain-containing protein n=1 Tax=Cotesia glomerata TaxID=32391 RepID=A0AAV7HXI2_COTGL|nr:hypothetical protein KQX54_013724 [Cotesia glomerata]
MTTSASKNSIMNFTKVSGIIHSFLYHFRPRIYKEIKGSNEEKFRCISYKSKFKCPAKIVKTARGYERDFSEHNHPEPKSDLK